MSKYTANNVIDLEQFRLSSQIKYVKKNMDQFLGMIYTRFLIDYPKVGTEGLVAVLNQIADASNTQEAYDSLFAKPGTVSFKKDLLKWASSFSRRGGILLDWLVDAEIKTRILAEEDNHTTSFMHDDSDMKIYQFQRDK